MQQHNPGKLSPWRFMLWAAVGSVLLCPLVAIQFTAEMRWDRADFAVAAVLLVSLGAAVELAFLCKRSRTRALLIGTSFIAVMLIWSDAAVGVF